jgi:peroxiredoxin
MTARQQWAVVGVVVAVLAGALYAGTHAFREELFPITSGAPAPDFSATPLVEPVLPGADDTLFVGRVVESAPARTLADYRGEVVLLNVWATWCPPCRAEMPSLERLHREFARRGLRIVAVSVDEPGQAPKIHEFAKQYGLTFEILHDESKRIQRDFRTTGLPETFVIARDGIIRKKVIGADDWSSAGNRSLIAQLLAEPAPGERGR